VECVKKVLNPALYVLGDLSPETPLQRDAMIENGQFFLGSLLIIASCFLALVTGTEFSVI
jgi:hypothetical protein